MKMPRNTVHRIALKTLVTIPLLRLKWNIHKKLNVLEQTISTFETEHARSVKLGAKNFARIHDASLFLTLLSFDLTVLTDDHIRELRESRKNFYSRQLCLLIFEALEDIPTVFGKDFRTALTGIATAPEVMFELGQHTKKITELSKKYAAELKEIRSFAGAHREHNALTQLRIIRKVDVDKIGMIAQELDAVIRGLVLWLTEIARTMGNAGVILRNIHPPI